MAVRRVADHERAHTAHPRADDGPRTRDPQLGKLVLYQLSYVRRTDVNDTVRRLPLRAL
jgi:hypothetical protein